MRQFHGPPPKAPSRRTIRRATDRLAAEAAAAMLRMTGRITDIGEERERSRMSRRTAMTGIKALAAGATGLKAGVSALSGTISGALPCPMDDVVADAMKTTVPETSSRTISGDEPPAEPDVDPALDPAIALFLPALLRDWSVIGRPEQRPPAGDWRTWLIMGGRGSGKTRAGAEWVHALASAGRRSDLRIALVAETLGDAREVMIDGTSGICRIARRNRPDFEISRRRLVWPNGAIAQIFSSEDPEALRGPQFHFAWCDELGKWKHAEDTFDMLQFGLRLGHDPRQLITTTPRPIPLMKRLISDATTRLVRIATADNATNLAPGFVSALQRRYGGTRLGRQELDGEMIEDRTDALWKRADLEAAVIPFAGPARGRIHAPLRRIVVAVDPPSGAGEQSCCGIVVAGIEASIEASIDLGIEAGRRHSHGPGASPVAGPASGPLAETRAGSPVGPTTRPIAGPVAAIAASPMAGSATVAARPLGTGSGPSGRAVVLADCSVEGMSPAGWAMAVVNAYRRFGADRVVAEVNQGGEMVAAMLKSIDANLPITIVRASRGKFSRAEPVAALYEQGRVAHAGRFTALEDQMCDFGPDGLSSGRSPDRLDALVWALTALMLEVQGEPRVRTV